MQPLDRLRTLVHAFIRSEYAEPGGRTALHDAAPLYRDAPEAYDARIEGDLAFQAFMREVLTFAQKETCALAGDLITTTLRMVGKEFAERPRTTSEIETYADAMADMFCAYISGLA